MPFSNSNILQSLQWKSYDDRSLATYLREMQDVGQTRMKHHRIKYVEKKLKKTLTTFVTKQITDGTIMEFTDKVMLEEEIIVENLKKYHQTEDSCPLFDQLLHRKIGPLGNGTARDRILNGTYMALHQHCRQLHISSVT